MNKYESFMDDVNKAYENKIACPLRQEYYNKDTNGRKHACAIAAAYLVNSGSELDDTLEEETLLFNWAMNHYGFTEEELLEIVRGFDSNIYDPTKAALTGNALAKKWFDSEGYPITDADDPIIV